MVVWARGRSVALLVVLLAVSTTLGSMASPANAKHRVRLPKRVEVDPGCGAPGEQIVLRRADLAFPKRLRVLVGGARAGVVSRSRSALTIVLPELPNGRHDITLNRSARVVGNLTVSCRLAGDPADLAVDAIQTITPVAAPPADIAGDVILTRLTLYIEPNATVSQINAAIGKIGGRITGAVAGSPVVTVTIPRQDDAADVRALAAFLTSFISIVAATPSTVLSVDNVPAGLPSSTDHQVRTRFPAAWNALALAKRDCASRRVQVLVPDHYTRPIPSEAFDITSEIPRARIRELGSRGTFEHGTHGYNVLSTLAADFDRLLVGAAPLPECLDFTALNIADLGSSDVTGLIAAAFPSSGKFIINTSLGFATFCGRGQTCVPANIDPSVQLEHALDTVAWKAVAAPERDRFFHAASAGNIANDSEGTTYPATALSEFNSEWDAAAITDATLGRFGDSALWAPAAGSDPDFPNLALTLQKQDVVDDAQAAFGTAAIGPLTNTLAVGSIDQTGAESSFSNRQPHVRAVGERIPDLNGRFTLGTSFSSPQVAGLAAYLWLLSDDLRNQPASTTATLIKTTTDHAHPLEIDALSAVLSLDAVTTDPTPENSPVRLAMLDVDDSDGRHRFDQADLKAFHDKYIDANGEPKPDVEGLSRFDLNGDGSIGAQHTEDFDLDTSTSTRFGASDFGFPHKDIDGSDTSYIENLTSDLDVVCYYAYSHLYTGDTFKRGNLMGAPCAEPNITIVPDDPTVAARSTLRFVADVENANDPTVTWTASRGSITQQGLFTAPDTSGLVTVTASLVEDPRIQDEVTVSVTAGLKVVAQAFAFSPTTLDAPAGAVHIEFENRDSTGHNLTVKLGAQTIKGTQTQTGPSTQFLDFTATANTYQYVCTIHPTFLHGTLTLH